MARAGRPLLALLWALLALPWAGAQVDRSEQLRLEAEIAEGQRLLEARLAEIDAITGELGGTEAALRARIGERDRLSGQLAELAAQRVELQAGLATLRDEVAATEARVADLDVELEQVKERVRGLLVNLHRQRASGYGTSLARADSFHDLAVKQRFVGLLAAQDVALVGELDALIAELGEARAMLTDQIASLEARERDLAANAVELEGARGRLEAVIDELRSTEAGQRAQQRSLLEAQEALAAQLNQLDRTLAQEVARLEAEERDLRRRAQEFVDDRAGRDALVAEADATRARIDNLVDPIPSPAQGYVAPLDDGVVVSRFGEGNNSYVSLQAAAAGAAVRVVRAGVVFTVAPIGANDGYLVAVRHDDTTMTVYTNLRPPVVATGDAVDRGAVLGYLGGGTLIPADVLRFYVRRTDGAGNTQFVDPGPILGL